MTKPRSQLVNPDATPYYHCVSRCVRRAFLCGNDPLTKKSFEHRRGWIEEKLLFISQFFMIDIASYAIMSNHYHVVLHLDTEAAKQLSDLEVVKRWHSLFKGTELSHCFADNKPIEKHNIENLNKNIALWRERLCNIGWFMRCINEPLARMANKEDLCTGRFWEGRFKSQALLDEKSLLACMAYVDLNPIRAGLASELEKSDHTSIKKRLEINAPSSIDSLTKLRFINNDSQSNTKSLPFSLKDYLNLVDWTGRHIRKETNGIISDDRPFILDKFQFSESHWLYITKNFESKFRNLVGGFYKLQSAAKILGLKRAYGLANSLKFFGK